MDMTGNDSKDTYTKKSVDNEQQDRGSTESEPVALTQSPRTGVPLHREISEDIMSIVDDHPDASDSGRKLSETDPSLITWDSDDDPKNPRNWSLARKWRTVSFCALLSVMPNIISTVPEPATARILKTYNNSNTEVGSLIISIMLLFWSISALVVGPISEIVGRRATMLGAGAWSGIWSLACGFAPTTATMLVFRSLNGLFSVAPMCVGGGTCTDLFNDDERNWPLASWSLAPSIGPVVGPIIGGWVNEFIDWRWTFWIATCMQFGLIALCVFGYEETYAPFILKNKCRKLIKTTGNKELHTLWDINKRPFIKELGLALLRPILFLTTNPLVFGLSLFLAFSYGMMYLMLTTFTDLWEERYGFSSGIAGTMYVSFLIGMVVGTIFFTTLMSHHQKKRHLEGRGKQEDKLFYLPISAIIMSIGMFWYGWSAKGHVHWMMPEVGVGLFGFGMFVVFQAVQSYCVQINPQLAGSIMAAALSFRGMVGFGCPLFGRQMYDRLDYGWANTVIGLLMIVIGVPYPMLVYRYGPAMRAWSDRHSIIR